MNDWDYIDLLNQDKSIGQSFSNNFLIDFDEFNRKTKLFSFNGKIK
jgi:hypothetical protein